MKVMPKPIPNCAERVGGGSPKSVNRSSCFYSHIFDFLPVFITAAGVDEICTVGLYVVYALVLL